jgi:Mrp family chromosome partitioning ATPase
MSVNLLVEEEEKPVVWRGPVIAGVITQFYTDVAWGDVDYLFIDMPPGTGDVPLTVFQSIPLAGIVIVTTPQDLVKMVVEKAVNMAAMMEIPVLGIVENMSYLSCPDCGKKIEIFGQSKVAAIAQEYGIPSIARMPLDPALAALSDAGEIEKADTFALSDVFAAIERA